jgi:hypothetical protein
MRGRRGELGGKRFGVGTGRAARVRTRSKRSRRHPAQAPRGPRAPPGRGGGRAPRRPAPGAPGLSRRRAPTDCTTCGGAARHGRSRGPVSCAAAAPPTHIRLPPRVRGIATPLHFPHTQRRDPRSRARAIVGPGRAGAAASAMSSPAKKGASPEKKAKKEPKAGGMDIRKFFGAPAKPAGARGAGEDVRGATRAWDSNRVHIRQRPARAGADHPAPRPPPPRRRAQAARDQACRRRTGAGARPAGRARARPAACGARAPPLCALRAARARAAACRARAARPLRTPPHHPLLPRRRPWRRPPARRTTPRRTRRRRCRPLRGERPRSAVWQGAPQRAPATAAAAPWPSLIPPAPPFRPSRTRARLRQPRHAEARGRRGREPQARRGVRRRRLGLGRRLGPRL